MTRHPRSKQAGSLDAAQLQDLSGRPLTYEAVGRVLTDPPMGFDVFARSTRVSSTRPFDDLVEDLLTWRVQLRSGLRVSASTQRAQEGADVLMRFGIGIAALKIPCRVVLVLDESDRRGFAYGTLAGHPECGE